MSMFFPFSLVLFFSDKLFIVVMFEFIYFTFILWRVCLLDRTVDGQESKWERERTPEAQ